MTGTRILSDLDGSMESMQELSGRDAELLSFARDWFATRGGLEAAVRSRFDMSVTRYWQELNRVIDLPAAEAFDPFTCRRLRRVRSQRERSRSLRRP